MALPLFFVLRHRHVTSPAYSGDPASLVEKTMTAASLLERLALNFRAHSLPGAEEADILLELIREGRLTPVFQPILDYRGQSYMGFEGLIRGPIDSPLHTPAALFELARRLDLTMELERACRIAIFRAFAQLNLPGNLFVNVSPGCLKDPEFRNGETQGLLRELGLSPSRIIIELTENQQIEDFADLHDALMH